MVTDPTKPVLQIEDLSVAYVTDDGFVNAVNDVNLTLYPGEIVGLVGESGSGKSTMSNAIMRLLKGDAIVTKGRVKVLGQDVYAMSEKQLRQFRWSEMSMVFQSAMSALNPVMTVETQILDTLLSHDKKMTKAQAIERARELMNLVRIDTKHLASYPHELSGGMRQRVVIAIAIALNPSFVIMDEPTTALDVVVQRSILNEIRHIQEKVGFAILFVSHDFSLVAELARRVAIMYAGRIVELTPSDTLSLMVNEKHHPYTTGLLQAIPELTAEEVIISGIPGNPPNLRTLPTGCAFHPRCPVAMEICSKERPAAVTVGESDIECHLYTGKGVEEHV